ncbi:uncharacterized protein C8A04DRAFT_32089 [Dichotomopilus funicola]|uniref:BTB domain transcription factor n=1 Tax=Dichotomopilus funicola TaxID=1934379 RepID=A0AAN6UYV4_9PEZI|nr:hypothetical protein C8A04DRAFT_32089 [Dichotomopilus funicola]
MTTTTRAASKKEEDPSSAAPASEAKPGSKHKTEDEEVVKPPSPKKAKQEDENQNLDTEQVKEETKDEEKKQENGAPEDQTTKQEPPIKEPKDSAVEPQAHKDTPASILEKGIIYFFYRGRVNTDSPSSINDIARAFILLRPIAHDAKLSSGPIGDAGNSRLLLVPKKTLPRSGRDRWISFVEKSHASFAQLRDDFLASAEYTTKTAGDRHTPAATPVGEGVYALTSTGRQSHLVYVLTLPGELGEVQEGMGLKARGSFIVSTKNPEYGGPGPKGAEYPKELLEEFRSLRWSPTQPKHLDYVHTQILMVGESSGTEKALSPQKEDQEEGKAEPEEEIEELEEEDIKRMEGLSEDDSGRVFADLQVHAEDYPKLRTTF